MQRQWTFGQKIAAGLGLTVVLAMASSVVAVWALRGVVAAKDRVVDVHAQNLIIAAELGTSWERKVAAGRGYLLTQEDRYVEEVRKQRTEHASRLAALRAAADSPESASFANDVERLEDEHQTALDRAFALRRSGSALEEVAKEFDLGVSPKRDAATARTAEFVRSEHRTLEAAKKDASAQASQAQTLVVLVSIAMLLFAIGAAVVLGRSVSQQIGSAIQHIQTSSAELQSAASQQAAGAKEQTSATTEVMTTLKELGATSRQIAESAQRVTGIAEDTFKSARGGEQTVGGAQRAIANIKKQVDLVVQHMLDLGKKSQQVGSVLEIINELAEQTNILAINATIESAGAGDAGRRFAVVADEIRRLADRVGASTKEIRSLVDEIRAAANTTVMATEDGAKAVDAGTRQFGDVASALEKIAAMVETTTDAAREIELGTKQQATAVEQVIGALGNLAQGTKEAEASTRQTLETSEQLVVLSKSLVQLVQRAA